MLKALGGELPPERLGVEEEHSSKELGEAQGGESPLGGLQEHDESVWQGTAKNNVNLGGVC